MKSNTQRSENIPSFVAVLGRQGPSIQSQSKTQTASIASRDGRRKLTKRNIHLLRSGKKSQNSRLNGEDAAIYLPPTKITESTKETPKPAALHTDGRCRCVVGVARFLILVPTKRHSSARHFKRIRGPPVVGTPKATKEGIYICEIADHKRKKRLQK
jgi:hypothetical protein